MLALLSFVALSLSISLSAHMVGHQEFLEVDKKWYLLHSIAEILDHVISFYVSTYSFMLGLWGKYVAT